MQIQNPFSESVRDFCELIQVGSRTRAIEAGYGDIIADYETNAKAFDVVLEHFVADGFGATFKHAQREQWAFVLVDPSYAGRIRIQTFAADGFVGHETHATEVELLEALVTSGFTAPAPRDTLPKISATDQFATGSERLDLIMAYNSKRIDSDDFHSKMRALAA